MNDLLLPARLQAALGDAYLLERELGGGGMSRLFVAQERSLNRPVVIKVLFSAPDNRSHFQVELFPDSRIAGWQSKGLTERREFRTPRPMAQAEAAQAFHLLTGSDSQAFRLTTDGAPSKEGLRYTWEPGMSTGGFQPTIDVVVSHGEVVHAQTHASYSKGFDADYQRAETTTSAWRIGFFVMLFVMILAAAVLYTLGAIRKTIDHRRALAFGTVNMLLAAAGFLCGPKLDGIFAAEILDGKSSISALYQICLSFLGTGAMAWVLFGGGIFAAGATLEKWWSLRMLFSARFFSRPVGRSLCAGLLWAPALVGTQAVVAAAFPMERWFVNGPGDLFVRFPVLFPLLDYPFHPTVIGFFGVAFAFVLTRTRTLWLRGLCLSILCPAFFFAFENHWNAWPAMALSALLSMAVLFGIYRGFDLLALVVAETGRGVLLTAAILLCQPSAGLHAAGWRAIAVLTAALAAGLVLIVKGHDPVNEEDAATRPLGEGIQAKRDELQSEFNIAQRAQRDMLPDSAPPIPGFTLSAHCTPARDVGGDLYDFLPLGNGRLGIAVADVSGKGVPAALYMTLTKGLLAATTQEDLELSLILEHINGHLYTVGRRKTFVTMALAILDPRLGTLEYARAGHNPVVWRKASDGSAELVRARGMGLGITGGKVFARTLAVQTLQLEPGDFVVFYSDGLTEAMNSSLEQFGDDRLLESIARLGRMGAEEARDEILKDVAGFLNGTHPQDDLTLVVLKFD